MIHSPTIRMRYVAGDHELILDILANVSAASLYRALESSAHASSNTSKASAWMNRLVPAASVGFAGARASCNIVMASSDLSVRRYSFAYKIKRSK
jgi:hypothetical protein